MELKSIVMDENSVRRSMARITHEIIEKNKGTDDILLLGIRRRGEPLARMLAENVKRFEGTELPVAYVDISMYRDDLSEKNTIPVTKNDNIPFDVSGKKVIIVDDVIYTGRTARAAIEAVFDKGRPKEIQLAVLIDRGHRELPIRPDYVGKNLPTSRNEVVSVQVEEFDGATGVALYSL